MPVKIALPKGRLAEATAALMQAAAWGLDGYNKAARLYHLKSARFPALSCKIFHEKDIPIQVAIGNYDLGICGLDWAEELLAKYQSGAIVKVRDLGYGRTTLYMAASRFESVSLAEIKSRKGVIRIAGEYPNLAESFALKNRLGRFSVFPVWGGAEAYPPENVDLALMSVRREDELGRCGLLPVSKVLESSAFVIANRNSWEAKDLGHLVASICDNCEKLVNEAETQARALDCAPPASYNQSGDGMVRLALPDGHQQTPTVELLNKAGIKMEDYPSTRGNRRPGIDLEGVTVKVIRPQDMPLQVANGNFDLALTGKDWLTDHLCQFPASPVKALADLKFGKVRLVAVVSKDVSATDIAGLRQLQAGQAAPLRVASEYVNIADKYARDNRLGHYRVIPTWGATESFLTDDADLLIENTQTGKTIAEHNLKIIDTLFESAACLIGSTRVSPAKAKIIKLLVTRLSAAAEGEQ